MGEIEHMDEYEYADMEMGDNGDGIMYWYNDGTCEMCGCGYVCLECLGMTWWDFV